MESKGFVEDAWSRGFSKTGGTEFYTMSLAMFKDGKGYVMEETVTEYESKEVAKAVFDRRKKNQQQNPERLELCSYGFEQENPVYCQVTELAHDTQFDKWCLIELQGLKGFSKDHAKLRNIQLSWWHITIQRDECPEVPEPSYIFSGKSQYLGDIRIRRPISVLYAEYLTSRPQSDICLRFLGTFVYDKEIMFAIMVCTKTDPFDFHELTPGKYGPFDIEQDLRVIWNCSSPSAYYRMWDHVAFAFYLPGDLRMHIPKTRSQDLPNDQRIIAMKAVEEELNKIKAEAFLSVPFSVLPKKPEPVKFGVLNLDEEQTKDFRKLEETIRLEEQNIARTANANYDQAFHVLRVSQLAIEHDHEIHQMKAKLQDAETIISSLNAQLAAALHTQENTIGPMQLD